MRSFNLLKRGHGLRYGDQVSEDKQDKNVDSTTSTESAAQPNPRLKKLAILVAILLGAGAWFYFTARPSGSPPKARTPATTPTTPGALSQPGERAPGALLEAAQRTPEKVSPPAKAKPAESIERIPIEPLPPPKPAEVSPPPPAPVPQGKEPPAIGPAKSSPPAKTDSKAASRAEQAAPLQAPAAPPRAPAAARKKAASPKPTPARRAPAAAAYQIEVASCVSEACLQKAQSQIQRAGYKPQQSKVGRKAEMYLVVGGEFSSGLLAQRRQRELESQGLKTTIHPIEDGKQAVVAGIFEDLAGARSQRKALQEQGGSWRILRRAVDVESVTLIVGGFHTYEEAVKAKARLSAKGLHPELRMVKK